MDIKHGSFNLKWLTVTLIKDVDDEGFRGSKSSMLVTTKAERMNREAAKTSSDDTDRLWEGVAILGTPHHHQWPGGCCKVLAGAIQETMALCGKAYTEDQI